MKLESINQLFSDMEWINPEVVDRMVEVMRIIREKQNNGIIPFEEYKEFYRHYCNNFCKDYLYLESPLVGYYMINIVYDFYCKDAPERESVEDRFIFFLQNFGNKFSLTKDKDFIDDFIIDCYRRFLMWIKRTPTNSYDLIIEQGSFVGKEKEIFKLLWDLYLKEEFILEHVYINQESSDMKNQLSIYEEAQIIDLNNYKGQDEFVNSCKEIIKNRIDIIKKYSINFSECKNHQIQELSKLKTIIIFCGAYNYELEDLMYCILEDMCGASYTDWYKKYGLSLVTDY